MVLGAPVPEEEAPEDNGVNSNGSLLQHRLSTTPKPVIEANAASQETDKNGNTQEKTKKSRACNVM
jgi:hypothetical protein